MATYDEKTANSFINFVNSSNGKKSATYDAFINELPVGLEGKYIVDLGCGTAYITQQVARANPQSVVIGLDENEQFLKYAKVQCAALVNIQLKQGNMNTMEDFEDNSIDVAISCFAFPVHTPRIQDAVDCLSKKMKKGGKLILETSLFESKNNCELPSIPVPLRLAEDLIVCDYLYSTSKLHQALTRAVFTDIVFQKSKIADNLIDPSFSQKCEIDSYETVITASLSK